MAGGCGQLGLEAGADVACWRPEFASGSVWPHDEGSSSVVSAPLAPPSANQGWICRLQGARENIHCMWRCPRPGLNPSGLVKNSSLAAGSQFTEVKVL